MGKSAKQKYYAVKIGRDGPQVYHSWDECTKMVSRYPGAVHKSFTSLAQAEEWLRGQPPIPRSRDRTPHPTTFTLPQRRGYSSKFAPDDPIRADPSTVKKFETDQGQIQLSSEQTAVLNLVASGRSVFFTGSAGTGKSVLLREIIKYCGGRSSSLAITASTGMASVNIGGVTLHSWAGIGLGDKEARVYVHILRGESYDKVAQRWRDVKTLILDEISMIDGILFHKLEYIARKIRQDERPFGGIQLVLSGDFCQLPPVEKRNLNTTFAFDADSWNRCVGLPINLTRVFRQKDQAFVNMLNEIRYGRLDKQTIAQLKNLSRAVVYNDHVEPTDLFPTTREVEKENNARLDKLKGKPETFVAYDTPGENDRGEQLQAANAIDLLNKNLIAPETITLKVGAQVMLIKNLVQGEFVNGSVGQVVAFYSSLEAQNTNTEVAYVDRGRERDPRSPTNAPAKPAIPQELLANSKKWPVVRFSNGMTKLCPPTEFTVDNVNGRPEASRSQVPLILAWALSIHKSQGQTLQRVRVNLGRIFAKGQAYVALSRATSMETLQVLNLETSKVLAHPRVLAWHEENLERQRQEQEFEDEMDAEAAVVSYFSP